MAPICATDEELDDHGDDGGDRCALAVGAERARHPPDGLGDDRHGDELEAMQQAGPDRSLQELRAVGKEQEQNGGWQREGSPCGEAAEIAAAHQANGKPDLAAGRPRQELAQRDQIGEGGFVDPAAPDHEFLSEIADVGDRAAKGADAELGEDAQHLQG
jgi:hypothetical protein